MKKLTKKIHSEDHDRVHKKENQNFIPIVYSDNYEVKFCGLQKLHPFDAAKGKHIMKILKSQNLFLKHSYFTPNEICKKDLLKVHTKKYLKSLKWSFNAARISEIPLLVFLPNPFVQNGYLKPMRFQTAGSILAGKLALETGWSINLGGGFHHCCSYKGAGFCPYADITLLIKNVQDASTKNESSTARDVMIIDLDAHQGNGHERDFMDDKSVYILDMYNSFIYPRDHQAKLAISCAVELRPRTGDELYLNKLKKAIKKSLNEFKPDLIVYNAGTDILEHDPLGLLSITPDGIIERDEIVFSTAINARIPIVMLMSGGYLKSSSGVIADSILNLKNKNLLIL